MLVKFFIATVVLLNITPNFGSPQNVRQSLIFPPTSPNESSGVNVTDITNVLNLTNYLQPATPQIQQAIQNFTAALQSASMNLQEAVQAALIGVSLQGQNIAQGIQTFITNFQAQLSQSSPLTQTIAILQNFFNSSANAAALQNLVNAVGPNLPTAPTNLQSQLNNLAQFLQGGLSQLSSSGLSNLQNIQALSNALKNGTLNQGLTNIITNFQGRTLQFQTILNILQQQANASLQSVISSVQGGVQTFLNALDVQFRNVLNIFTGFFQPSIITTAAPQTNGVNGVFVIGPIQPRK